MAPVVLTIAFIAYLLGSIPWGLIVGRSQGIDIRQHGSGIEGRITYWPITRDASVARPSIIGPTTLVGA